MVYTYINKQFKYTAILLALIGSLGAQVEIRTTDDVFSFTKKYVIGWNGSNTVWHSPGAAFVEDDDVPGNEAGPTAFTGASQNDSFAYEISGVLDWDMSIAQQRISDGTFVDYVTGLTPAEIKKHSGKIYGYGIRNAPNEVDGNRRDKIDDPGEALIIKFDTRGEMALDLATGTFGPEASSSLQNLGLDTHSRLVLTEMFIRKWNRGNSTIPGRVDYLIYDASEQRILQSESGQDALGIYLDVGQHNETILGPWHLEHGDILVVSHPTETRDSNDQIVSITDLVSELWSMTFDIEFDPSGLPGDLENLALFSEAIATQSSVRNRRAAERAIDGDTNPLNTGNSIAQTNASGAEEAWWQVDLGGDRYIEKVILYNHSVAARLRNFRVRVINDAGSVVASRDFYTDSGNVGLSEEWDIGAVVGRVVRIDLLGPNVNGGEGYTLALAEVEVFGAFTPPNTSIVNLTQFAGVKASQSTTSATRASAQMAIDGNTSGVWGDRSISLTDPSAEGAWWEVDLGHVANINAVILYNRNGSIGQRLSNYRISILNDTRATVISQSFFTNSGHAANQEIWGALDTRGRFVRVELLGVNLRGDHALSLAEAQIIGSWDPYSSRNPIGNGNSVIPSTPLKQVVLAELSKSINFSVATGQDGQTVITLDHRDVMISNLEMPTEYQWSVNLEDWYDADGIDGPSSGLKVQLNKTSETGMVETTSSVSDNVNTMYLRIRVGEE